MTRSCVRILFPSGAPRPNAGPGRPPRPRPHRRTALLACAVPFATRAVTFRIVLAPHGPATDRSADSVLAAAARLSPGQCLEAYRRGYRLRLLEAMRGLHPALRALLGDALFDDCALEYLASLPSRSHTLFQLDARFADFLAEHRPDRDRPAAGREAWIDVVTDLAYDRPLAAAARAERAPVHAFAAAVRRAGPPGIRCRGGFHWCSPGATTSSRPPN
ncbi:DNA-binding domain-containing protein [Kitasatospora sp. NPDC059648]|uniref:HvfC/BufC N-terminal domain-containing protein n=1 Tax=Kitasatospora sp. NPDC059648 TaxID=3346894 RepID=UPI0036B90708